MSGKALGRRLRVLGSLRPGRSGTLISAVRLNNSRMRGCCRIRPASAKSGQN